MKQEQLLEQNLNRWASISGLSFCLIDEDDSVLLRTADFSLPENPVLDDFRESGESCRRDGDVSLYRVTNSGRLSCLLAVKGPEDTLSMVGPLAVCQVESLLAAVSSHNDKTQFLQELLHGHLSGRELEQQARHFHMETESARVLLLIETNSVQDPAIQSIIRTVLGNRSRNAPIPVNDNLCAILRETGSASAQEETDTLCHMLVGALNSEAMVKACVSYSNPFASLSYTHRAYQEAASAMEIGRIFNAERNVSGYAHLGVGRIIYQLPKDICELFVNEILQAEKLDSIDEETLNIIRTFFDNNLNLSETARQLYVHRNTLVYRFEKIEKKYGLDIRNFEDAMLFKLAMLVSDYLFYLDRNPS